jgi:hypothetical protein
MSDIWIVRARLCSHCSKELFPIFGACLGSPAFQTSVGCTTYAEQRVVGLRVAILKVRFLKDVG